MAWYRKFPVHTPTSKYTHAMAYDPVRDKVVLFGGAPGDVNDFSLGQTWIWDGTDWTQVFPATVPTARDQHHMVWDPVNQVVFMWGGKQKQSPTGNIIGLRETWTWNGINWTQLSPSTKPLATHTGFMVYDQVHNNIVYFGGVDVISNSRQSTTWIWNGSNWTQVFPAHSPPAISLVAQAWDPNTSKAVFQGGSTSTGTVNQMWSWNGTDWTQLTPSNLPNATSLHWMGVDSKNLLVQLNESTILQSTWIWNGSTWDSPVLREYGPGRTNQHAYSFHGAYDSARKELVCYEDGNTWVWKYGIFPPLVLVTGGVAQRILGYFKEGEWHMAPRAPTEPGNHNLVRERDGVWDLVEEDVGIRFDEVWHQATE